MTFTLKGITAGYGPTPVLRDVDLTVPDGSVVALLGPNGAGKTTLLRVASGLLRPIAGQIVADGQGLANRPAHVFAEAGICHIPEGRGIFRTLTVRDNLRFQAVAGSEEETIESVVMTFPALGRRLDQVAGTLSGGEQQMLALSRAYTSRASVVLLDEVSLGLAPKVVDEIFEFLEAFSARGVALFLVEQYVQRALALADYVYLMDRGEVVFAGEPAELDTDEVFRSYVGGAV
ncbi:MAG: ABC transporter ATP-binding protein [Acidimicrobiales bacterium]